MTMGRYSMTFDELTVEPSTGRIDADHTFHESSVEGKYLCCTFNWTLQIIKSYQIIKYGFNLIKYSSF